MHNRIVTVFGALALAAAYPAGAQEEPITPTAPSTTGAPTPTEMTPEQLGAMCPPGMSPMVCAAAQPAAPARPQPRFSPANLSVAGGAGFGNFARGSIADSSNIGPMWDVRLGVGTRSIFAFEAQYVGSAQGTDLNLIDNPTIVTHQLTGALRVNFTRMRIQPFVYGGAGWAWVRTRLSRQVGEATVAFDPRVDGGTFPVGGGITGYIGKHFLLEGRGSYSFMIGQRELTVDNARPDVWAAQFNAGYAF